MDGDILTQWARAGYETSEYGYPTGDVGPGSEPGSRIQTFQNGTIYTKPGLFQGVIVPASGGPVIFPGDSTNLPAFPAAADVVDQSCYNSKNNWSPDDLAMRANLQDAAGGVGIYVSQFPHTGPLWDNYQDIDNGPPSYEFDSQTVTNWLSNTTQYYPDEGPPGAVKQLIRETAIQEAIAKADQAGKAVKVLRGTNEWVPVGSNADVKDYFYATGRHQMATTVAVIAHPGANGQHSVKTDQGTAMWDVYDFHPNEVVAPAEAGATIGFEMCNYGLAAPFLTFGTGQTESWNGLK